MAVRLNFSFVKDIHVVGEKMTRSGHKMDIWASRKFWESPSTYLSLWTLLSMLAFISSINGSATTKEVRDKMIKSSLIVPTFMITAINKLLLLMTEMSNSYILNK